MDSSLLKHMTKPGLEWYIQGWYDHVTTCRISWYKCPRCYRRCHAQGILILTGLKCKVAIWSQGAAGNPQGPGSSYIYILLSNKNTKFGLNFYKVWHFFCQYCTWNLPKKSSKSPKNLRIQVSFMLVVILIIHTTNVKHYFTGGTSKSQNFGCSTTSDCLASLRIVFAISLLNSSQKSLALLYKSLWSLLPMSAFSRGPGSYYNSLSCQTFDFGLDFSKFWHLKISNPDSLSVTCHILCMTCHKKCDNITPQSFDIWEGESLQNSTKVEIIKLFKYTIYNK